MSAFSKVVFALVVTGSLCAYAAEGSGPVLPCVGCPEFKSSPLPKTGNWYNPQRSGTGFVLEAQGGRMVGYYFVYSESGDPEWLLFIGDLKPSEEPGVAWIVEADLERYIGGSCLNCSHETPTSNGTVGQIRIEFLQRNFARFQVDDGPFQRIWPLIFGGAAKPHFAPVTNYLVPKLDGFWSISVIDEEGMLYSRGVELIDIQQNEGAGTLVRIARLGRSPSIPTPTPPEQIGELRCGETDGIEGPICKIELDDMPDETFMMPLGNLGPLRFHAESDIGWVLHAHKIQTN